MVIKNSGWTWARAAMKAHALSLCNPGVTIWACLTPSDVWCISDNAMIADAAVERSGFLNGRRV